MRDFTKYYVVELNAAEESELELLAPHIIRTSLLSNILLIECWRLMDADPVCDCGDEWLSLKLELEDGKEYTVQSWWFQRADIVIRDLTDDYGQDSPEITGFIEQLDCSEGGGDMP